MSGSRSRRGGRSFVFERRNYQLMGLSVLLIVIAYSLMRFENEVDGVISLFVSPIMLFVGYLGVGFAILWRGGEKVEADESEDS